MEGFCTMMRKLRNLRRMRGPMIVLVIVLSIGLVGSVTFMALAPGRQQLVDQQMSLEEQREYLLGLKDEYSAELDANPDNQEAIGALAEIHLYLAELSEDEEEKKEHREQSYAYYQQLVEYDPDNVNLLVHVALSAHNAGKDEEAENYFKNALELEPNNVSALGNYGVFLMNAKGDFEGALDIFNKALEQELDENAKEQIESLKVFAEQMIEALEGNNDETESVEEDNQDSEDTKEE